MPHKHRDAAERTGDAVGDGTTTSTLLAHAIVADGMRNIAAGASAIDLKRGLDRAARAAIEALRGQSRPVQSQREKQQVATISAHNDPAVGALVAQAIERVGAEGAVTFEEAKGTETTMDVVEGLRRHYRSHEGRSPGAGERCFRRRRPAADGSHHDRGSRAEV